MNRIRENMKNREDKGKGNPTRTKLENFEK